MKKNKTALMKAAELLARQEQSSEVLRRKLLAKKYTESETSAALDTLKERNYLNDEETCARQFENFFAEGKLSIRQICAKLIQRGYDPEFVKNLVPENSDEHDLQAAQLTLKKNFSSAKVVGLDAQEKFKLRNKIYRHLAGKGFGGEIISSVMENFFGEAVDEENFYDERQF